MKTIAEFIDSHKLLIFFVPFLLYMLNGREISSGDPTPTIFVAANIVKHGSIFLDDLHDYIPYPSLPYYVSEQRGHIVSNYPILPGMMAAPIFAPFIWIGMFENVWAHLGKLTGALYTAASVMLMYLTLKYLIDKAGALILSMAYGLGTALWPIAAQSLWQHGPSVFWWTLCFYALVRAFEYNRLDLNPTNGPQSQPFFHLTIPQWFFCCSPAQRRVPLCYAVRSMEREWRPFA